MKKITPALIAIGVLLLQFSIGKEALVATNKSDRNVG